MKGLRPLVIAGALLSLAGVGHAADYTTLPPPASYMPPVAPAHIPRNVFLSGWYLRLDGGERWGFMTGADAPAAFTDPTTNSAGKATMIGIGAGFHYRWLRGDLTVDYAAEQKWSGTDSLGNDVSAKI